MKKRRTPRRDCNYVIYEARDQHGESYIGLTRKTSTEAKSIRTRWSKHLSRARCEAREWTLYQYLRSGALDHSWTHRVLAVIRGRAEAYARERELVKALEPTLNDQYIG